MGRRRVTHTGKSNGDITALCGSWSRVSKGQAIYHIDYGAYKYYVIAQNGAEVGVMVVDGRYGRYLRTDPDRTVSNNLDYLPDC